MTKLMTNLDIVRTSILAIIKQGGPSFNVDLCMYRTEDGKKCAAGVFIPDDAYDPKMEGEPWYYVVEKFPMSIPFGEDGHRVIGCLQYAHDYVARKEWSWSSWKRELLDVFSNDQEVIDLINELLLDVPSINWKNSTS